MQGNYDDQIGGAVFGGFQAPDMHGAGGNGGAAGGISGNSGGIAGGAGMRIEGDTKDVSASQNTSGAHNM
jgi:hypothetical protein